MKYIQVIDDAENATYCFYKVSQASFLLLFPQNGQDIELVEDFIGRVGEIEAGRVLAEIWQEPVRKQDVSGIAGTLFYGWAGRRHHLPHSKQEADRDQEQLSGPQRLLYERLRSAEI